MVNIRSALLSCIGIVCLVASAHADPYAPYRAVCELRVGGVKGSGTLIYRRQDYGVVLSCRHVCQMEGLPVVLRWGAAGNQITSGRVLKVVPGASFNDDLALVECGAPRGVRPVRIGSPCLSDRTWVSIGYRNGMRMAVASEGRMQSNMFVTDSPFVKGMSGGPTFDRYGRLIGVVVASDFVNTGVSCDGPLMRAFTQQYVR